MGWALIYYLTGSFLFILGREPSLLSGFLKIFIFLTFLKIFLATPYSMWDLSSLTRDRTCIPCSGSAKS